MEKLSKALSIAHAISASGVPYVKNMVKAFSEKEEQEAADIRRLSEFVNMPIEDVQSFLDENGFKAWHLIRFVSVTGKLPSDSAIELAKTTPVNFDMLVDDLYELQDMVLLKVWDVESKSRITNIATERTKDTFLLFGFKDHSCMINDPKDRIVEEKKVIDLSFLSSCHEMRPGKYRKFEKSDKIPCPKPFRKRFKNS